MIINFFQYKLSYFSEKVTMDEEEKRPANIKSYDSGTQNLLNFESVEETEWF